jgi:N-acetylmuramoyl-L-alanine amidase
MRIAISSGHGSKIPGAIGPDPWGLHEHTEAVRVVNLVAGFARAAGAQVLTYEDTISDDQSENLSRICGWHNQAFGNGGDLAVSVHFNSNGNTETEPRGTECWYFSQGELAEAVASEIAMASGLKDRGKKYSDGLSFLMNTVAPSILIEVAFVNSKPDTDLYRRSVENIAESIASVITGADIGERPPPVEPPSGALFRAEGTVSWFGGPDDTGVSSSEGLAFWYSYDEAPWLFLPIQPPNSTGLARRLNSGIMYCAARWPYDIVSKEMLRRPSVQALVRNPANGREVLCYPADWGPNQETTGRAMDLSLAALEILDLQTDDEAILIYPAPEAA